MSRPVLASVTGVMNLDTGPLSALREDQSTWHYEREDEVEIVTEPKNSDFAEEYGESATCVAQRLLCNQKNLKLHNDIKFSTRGVRSRARCAISSSTTTVVRTSSLAHWWTI